ncbi:NAD(P)/FAD-dependent oxidoreductase [Glutamicibacter sp. MNS18]|uniref:NAD(P)/FAD-dependent oxidoreductase n=1 Tax=Glutamicibacter sp. MNS18 TaxID=2989817 RepID=UPI002235F1DC|nr:NAD(P)/FAD-dependent oxidoreductase [Glutamicibacter sp. MNS18]MCW4464716.1 NAD(P)/FAD-dependent oxidoreductase [Glutamicibacter sp. MNS18]
MEDFDVIIIGAGAAGISAATALARSKRSVLVIDAGSPRNAASTSAHNLLGRDGISPHEILAEARQQAVEYGVLFRNEWVELLEGSLESRFTVRTSDYSYTARRIMLATGLRDVLPQIPGVQDGWGKTVLHCPYCHGWEVRDQRIAILGIGLMSPHQAQMFSQLSDRVTYINHAPDMLGEEERNNLAALSIPVIDTRVDALEFDPSGGLHSLRLANGQQLEVDAAVVMSRMEANARLYESMGGVLTDHPLGRHIATNQMGATDIPGVFAAGNVADLGAMVLAAAASGVTTGAGINYDLINERIHPVRG